MPSETFTLGDLTAIIGDNDSKGTHRAGYNGIWSLTHKTEPTNLCVSTVAVPVARQQLGPQPTWQGELVCRTSHLRCYGSRSVVFSCWQR